MVIKPLTQSMQHWNGDQLCAIDTETTGLDGCWHEVYQVAILPLDSNIEIRKDIRPFYINLKLENPERIDINMKTGMKKRIMEVSSSSFDKIKAMDLLEDWIKKLKLPLTKFGTPKRIIPLGQNYQFDRLFMISWLGAELYESWFSHDYKDTMRAASFLNDYAAWRGEPAPFAKLNLSWLAKTLNVEHDNPHDALQDALVTSKVYQQLLRFGNIL